MNEITAIKRARKFAIERREMHYVVADDFGGYDVCQWDDLETWYQGQQPIYAAEPNGDVRPHSYS